MWHILLYSGLLLIAAGYALLRGGAPERIGALVTCVGYIATFLLLSAIDRRFHSVEAGVLLVDGLAGLGFLVLLLCSTRFWPAWACAVQMVAVIVHLLRLLAPTPFAFPYAMVLAMLGYPLPMILIAGTMWHRRRLKLLGTDPSWRRSSPAA